MLLRCRKFSLRGGELLLYYRDSLVHQIDQVLRIIHLSQARPSRSLASHAWVPRKDFSSLSCGRPAWCCGHGRQDK